MVYRMDGSLFGCSGVVAIVKKSEKNKGKKKKRKGNKVNEEDVKKSPSDVISAAAGMIISSFRLGSQCK